MAEERIRLTVEFIGDTFYPDGEYASGMEHEQSVCNKCSAKPTCRIDYRVLEICEGLSSDNGSVADKIFQVFHTTGYHDGWFRIAHCPFFVP